VKPTLTTEELRRLGADGFAWSLHSRLRLNGDDTPFGFVAAEPARFAELVARTFATENSVPADVPAAATLGVSIRLLEKNRHVLVVNVDRDEDVRFRSLRSADDSGLYIDSQASNVAFVDIVTAGAVAVAIGSGELLLFCRGPDGESVDFFTGSLAVTEISDLDGIGSPVAGWVQETGDAWLIAAVGERVAADDPWNHTVAVGLYSRLRRPFGEETRRFVASILAGKPAADLVRAARWARELTPPQIDTLRRLTLAEIDLVGDRLAALDEEWQPDDADMVGELVELCHRRDDIEAVWQLIRDDAVAAELAGALEPLDERGMRFVASLPERLELADERLWRARANGVEGWWVSCAAPPG
jgi:hypothetical protein